jgi:membrane associated rhomboid family serine protease
MTKKARLPLWVRALITTCIVVEGGLTIADLIGYPSLRPAAFMLGAFWSQLLDHGTGLYAGQPVLMFLTYGLLHGGALHMAMNMLSLAAVARQLAHMIGSHAMALTYLLCQIAAALLFAVMQPQAGPMVGASGAVFGLAGALVGYATINLHRRHKNMAPLVRSVGLIVALNVALTLMMPAIAWQAHLGGAVAGLLIGLYLAWRTP